MSVTTTSNPLTQTLLLALTDYDLHHSGDPENPQRPADPNTTPSATTLTQQNPAWWPNDHRRIPPHRPINRELDRDLRPGGTNVVEQAFIYTMLRGVQVQANVSTAWRTTGGQLNDHIFRTPIGGER
ncbi:hypothetical protein EDD37DRAFT_98434 [Exophiala viscosa]|uniref:Uncharacterized protein n=1 Tax=Exophiala viscosa TaxID=2486360 RepID=A0AAN6E2Y4_9EURO|nr:hypothetical protein EDD36DRAFT_124912 [Exophiala viscosa]KAI1630285.1 hypothetical protein EDD37DRAFT_98434 [Exophiala viscosa]